jgi:hypothetical protein
LLLLNMMKSCCILLMEVNELMLTNVEEIEECQFQVNVEDLFHTMTTNANIYKQ